MLPDPHHPPSSTFQCCSRVKVPLAVSRQLGTPPISARLRPATVDRTTVPEATIDEYGDSWLSEDYVRATRQVFLWTDIYAVSKTTGV